jgi:hypothetical protein
MGQSTYIRDGFVSAGNAQVTGSLGVTGGITGALTGTATTASYISPTFISASAAASGFSAGTSVTINNNTDNYVVTATGTANTLNGESALTFNGTTLGVGVTTPFASTKAHIKGILGVENGSTAGTLADQLLFGYNGSGLTQYNHKIQTSHDSQPVLNKMDFLVSNGASTFLNVLTLRSLGLSRFDSGQGLGVSGSLQVTGSLRATSFAFISSGLVVGSELGGYVQSGNHKSQIIATSTQTPLMIQGGSGAVEIWKDSTPSKAVSFGMAVPGGSITSDFIFSAYQPSWVETMRITSAGNVGIGTTTPSAKLDVNGNTRITGSLLVNGTSLVAGYNPAPLEGTIQDGVTSVLGDLANWDSNYYQGDVLYSETAGGTITFGQLCYRTQNNVWILADATSISAAAINMLGICVKSSTSTNPTSILINGFVETATYAAVVKSGEPLYMATTAGSMTKTAPATAGNIVRLIGHTFWASNTNTKIIIRFNPENSWIEL